MRVGVSVRVGVRAVLGWGWGWGLCGWEAEGAVRLHLAVDHDVQADEIVLLVAGHVVLHGRIALGARLHLVEEVGDYLIRDTRGEGGAREG
eukprot:5903773-Prymnesium_polylepis.1